MSKLADSFVLKRTGRYVPIIESLRIDEEILESHLPGTAAIVAIRATFQRTAAISESVIHADQYGRALIEIRNTTVRAMIEEVFGEFRQPLLNALAAAHGRDNLGAAQNIQVVIDNMFAPPSDAAGTGSAP